MYRLKNRLFAIFLNIICSSCVFFINNPDPKPFRLKKKSALLRCLDDLQICSSNVFFINNPDPEPGPKLRLKPDPQKIISDPQH
jgi:hypothetical protein